MFKHVFFFKLFGKCGVVYGYFFTRVDFGDVHSAQKVWLGGWMGD